MTYLHSIFIKLVGDFNHFVKNSSLLSRDNSFFVQLALPMILKTIQIRGWYYQSNLLSPQGGGRPHPSTMDPLVILTASTFSCLLSSALDSPRERDLLSCVPWN